MSEVPPDCPARLEQLICELLHKNPAQRPADAQTVATELVPFTRRADLFHLASVWVPGEPIARPQTLESNTTPKVSRRALLGGAVAAAAATVACTWDWWLKRDTPTTAVSNRWRSLVTDAQPPPLLDGVMVHPGAPASHVAWDEKHNSIWITSEVGHTLVPLGQPILGQFRLRVGMMVEAREPTSECGLFFAARSLVDDNFRQRQRCQAILANVSQSAATLRWCALEWWNDESLQLRVRERAAMSIPSWQEVNVLEIGLGRKGFPEIVWNSGLLSPTNWVGISNEAEHFRKMTPRELRSAFLGSVGLLQRDGTTNFLEPQLMYET